MVSQMCKNLNRRLRLEMLDMLISIKQNCSKAFNDEQFECMLMDTCIVMISDDEEMWVRAFGTVLNFWNIFSVRNRVMNLLSEMRQGNEDAMIRHVARKISKATKNLKENIENSSSGFDLFQNVGALNLIDI